MRETRVLCRSIRTRSPTRYVNERLRPCRDAAIFRAYETRALKARRDRFARRYAADVIAGSLARASAPVTRGARLLEARKSAYQRRKRVETTKSPDGSRRRARASSRASQCGTVRDRGTRTAAFLRGERVSVPRSRCQGQAPRSRLPAHSLATAFRIERPTLSLDTAPNVPRARLSTDLDRGEPSSR